MIKVVILGAGNVASNLCNAFAASNEVSVVQVYNRSKNSLKSILSSIPTTTMLSEVKEATVYIIAIPDDAIKGFSETLPFKNNLVVHTSGSVLMNSLSENNRRGVFYPLQTFSKNKKINFSEIPICVEAENKSDQILLFELGGAISENVQFINSAQRAKLHLAAVIVNNFVNFLYKTGNDLLSEENLSFELLKPLIKETANKISHLDPKEVQTGPAKRNDLKTIEKQLHLLKDSPFKNLYQQLTKAISDTYGKKL